VGGALVMSGSWRPVGATAAEKPAVVIHESDWDAGERDTWSAFTNRVSSERGFRGQLLLTPTTDAESGGRGFSPGAAETGRQTGPFGRR